MRKNENKNHTPLRGRDWGPSQNSPRWKLSNFARFKHCLEFWLMGYSGRGLKQISTLRGTLKSFHAVAVLIFGHKLVIIFLGCGRRSNQGISGAHNGLLWCALRIECYTTRLQDSSSLLTRAYSNPHSGFHMSSQLESAKGPFTCCLGFGINKVLLAIALEIEWIHGSQEGIHRMPLEFEVSFSQVTAKPKQMKKPRLSVTEKKW